MISNEKNNKTVAGLVLVLRRYLGFSVHAFSITFSRFPVTLLLFFGLAAIIIYRIETPHEQLKNINVILDRLSGVMAMGIPFSLSIALLIEKFGQEKNFILRMSSYLAELVFLSLYYLFLFTDTNMVAVTRLLMVTLAMLLCFFFIPYLPQRNNFEIYVTSIITRAATTAFYTVVLALGLVATLFAIKSLLYNEMNSKIYGETWVLAWLVFVPVHFLYNLPCRNDNFTIEHFNKIIKIMLLYIVLPIISIYTIVLYIYFTKIIVTHVWPKGIVSYLVVSYTAAGIAAIFLVSPFREQNKWVKVFTAAFTKLIFPLLLMMFISIGIRISEFGFTENRYFILIIGLWSTFVMVFLNITKGKNNTMLPISLAVIALLTVFGPWNAFEVSKLSQSNRFYQIVSKYDLIQNGKVVANSRPVETRDQREISGILRYFERYHKLHDLKYLPAGFTMAQMKDTFGFSEVYGDVRTDKYFNYYRDRFLPLSISGYDLLFRLESFRYHADIKEINTAKGTIRLLLENGNYLTLFSNDRKVYEYDLLKYVQTLYDKYGTNIGERPKPVGIPNDRPEDMVLTDETATVKIMIVFQSIDGTVNPDNNELSINRIEGDIFVTIK
ncbi:MAG: DUF4153 domain-containing protein [Peptococcaceae bacterium]|jgi:hypothetical protein|nr:DUF4153 domain-containing protein [Peptococcaceae bacterium]MDH7524887.1 DUF4153 domain-containing protein [Peptococcaceae bacterium]